MKIEVLNILRSLERNEISTGKAYSDLMIVIGDVFDVLSENDIISEAKSRYSVENIYDSDSSVAFITGCNFVKHKISKRNLVINRLK